MSNQSGSKKYVAINSAIGICWVRDRDGILVIKPEVGLVHLFEGFEAALWDWVQLYTWPEIADLSTAYLRIPHEFIEIKVIEILKNWHQMGLIEVSGE